MRIENLVHANGQTTKVEKMDFPNNGNSVIMTPIDQRKDRRITYYISLVQDQWEYTFCIWIMIATIPAYQVMIWFPTFTDLRDYTVRYLPPKKTGITVWIADQIHRINMWMTPIPEKISFPTEEIH
jgi:hypothetical protein